MEAQEYIDSGILELYVYGLLTETENLEIAEMLNIKKSTVSTFKNRIFEKLEIDNLADLIDFFNLYS